MDDGDDYVPDAPAERLRRMRRDADHAIGEAMRRAHASGELRHLHGQPLHLDDDPDWLATKVLKSQGFSHPLIEAARDLDEPRREAEAVLERFRRRRQWLTTAESRATITQIQTFNESRERMLGEYRDRLRTLNSAIQDYNLTAPTALHQIPVRIDRAVEQAAREVPEIDRLPREERRQNRSGSFWRRWRRSEDTVQS